MTTDITSCKLGDDDLSAKGVKVDRSVPHRNMYAGTASALIAAKIIREDQLPLGAGRKAGRACFMPDGTPHPRGLPTLWALPGFMRVCRLRSGTVQVCIAVPLDEHRRRLDQRAADWREQWVAGQRAMEVFHFKHDDGSERFDGTREKLLARGLPARWMEGLPRPGKRGHTLIEEARRIVVRIDSAEVFSIHIEPIAGRPPLSEVRSTPLRFPANVIPFPTLR